MKPQMHTWTQIEPAFICVICIRCRGAAENAGRPSASADGNYCVRTRTRIEPGTGFSETTIMYPPPHPEYMAPGYRD